MTPIECESGVRYTYATDYSHLIGTRVRMSLDDSDKGVPLPEVIEGVLEAVVTSTWATIKTDADTVAVSRFGYARDVAIDRLPDVGETREQICRENGHSFEIEMPYSGIPKAVTCVCCAISYPVAQPPNN